MRSAASTMAGKRLAQSSPLRVKQRTMREPSRQAADDQSFFTCFVEGLADNAAFGWGMLPF
jgi:hypothetical protein